ncbi:hypothetical protein ACT3TY_12355 [Halomonas sp. AOP22-C1-8]|uniref:hypothetical protein n=2 Tax=Halomonas TaxID=2745 RepID=UPI004034D334
MAGLDMRGLADGFAQGFGLMNQYQRGQAADRRADEQLKIHRDNAAWQREDGDRRFGLSQDQFDQSVTDSDRRFGLAEKGFSLQERKAEHSMQTADRQLGLQQQQLGLQQSRFNAEQEAQQRARDQESIHIALAKAGQFGPESLSEIELDLMRRSPHVWPVFDSRSDAAIQRAADVFDINSPADANDMESLDQVNLLLDDLINVGEGGKKRISGWYPAPDGNSVTAELEMTREDGSTYRAPMTEGRGTEEDAMVMQIPIEKIVNHIQGIRAIRNAFNAGGPEVKNNANRMLAILRGEKIESGMSQDRLNDILDRYTKDQTSILTDDALIDATDRQSRLNELDAVYARNLGVDAPTLSEARQYAQSRGLSLTPQLLQAVQQELTSQAPGLDEGGNEEPVGLSISEEVEQRHQQRQKAREQRARVNEIDDVLGDIERTMQPPPTYRGSMLHRTPISPEQRQAWLQQIDELEASGDMTDRLRARAFKIAEQLRQP